MLSLLGWRLEVDRSQVRKELPLSSVSWNIVTSQNQEKMTDDVYVLSLGKR